LGALLRGDREMEDEVVPANKAKKIIKEALEARDLSYERLSSKVVSFSGFGYGSMRFVTIHGWKPNPVWKELEQIARENGFRIS
jgi:hypothetical protein